MSHPTTPAGSRRIGRLGRVASGAAAVVVLVVGGAAPAAAEPTRTMSIDPSDDVTSSPVVTGTFTGATLLGIPSENISGVDLAVTPTGPTGGSAVTQDGCEAGSGCTTGEVRFSWDIPALAYNGPYVVTASATYCAVLCLGAPQRVSADPIPFRLAVEPNAPTELKLEGGDDRSVVVSWARNPEPDILYYALFRKDPGGDFRRLGTDIKQPGSGRPSFTDTSAASSGGEFAYKVFAVRTGFSGDDKTSKISKASSERTTTVAPPPTIPVNPNDPAGGPVTTVAGQGVDIGSFLSGQAPTLPSPGPIFLDLPDTGFGETLPFGSFPGDELEPGEEDAVLPPTPRARQVAEFKRNRPLIPVAAGLILLVMAGHVRLLNVRTKAVPEKPPPGTYVARALEAARATSGVSVLPHAPPVPANVAIDVAAAVANGGHQRPSNADDVADLPVWAEFEPVSALGLLDAPDDRAFVRPVLPVSTAAAAPAPAVPVWAEFDAAWALGLLDAPQEVTHQPAPGPQPVRAVVDPEPSSAPAAEPAPPRPPLPEPHHVQALVEPEPFFAPEAQPQPDPFASPHSDDGGRSESESESEWAPEVFVGPRA